MAVDMAPSNIKGFAMNPTAALLRLVAYAERFGSECEDLYFTRLNVTGKWLPGMQGILFSSTEQFAGPQELVLSGIKLKVVRALTRDGLHYLNIYVHGLAIPGYEVGGLLGKDDHTAAALPTIGCMKQIELMQAQTKVSGLLQISGGSMGSIAEALAGTDIGKNEPREMPRQVIRTR